MIAASDQEKAEFLLLEWHDWTAAYRPALGAPRVAPYCKQSTSSRQYEDSTEASCGRLHDNEMKSVAFCVAQLTVPQQCSIGLEMRNRRAGARVWRGRTAPVDYQGALSAVVPIMAKEGLFD